MLSFGISVEAPGCLRCFNGLNKCQSKILISRTEESLNVCGELTLAKCQVPTKAALELPSSAAQGRGNTMKACGLDRERSVTSYSHGQDRCGSEK